MPAELVRRLKLSHFIAIVAGIIIGGGIFLVPNLLARSLPSASAVIGVWALALAISFIGALACAEPGSALPATGGQYVFRREAYGRTAAILCGWSFVINLLLTRPLPALAGPGVMLTGIPAWFMWPRYGQRPLHNLPLGAAEIESL